MKRVAALWAADVSPCGCAPLMVVALRDVTATTAAPRPAPTTRRPRSETTDQRTWDFAPSVVTVALVPALMVALVLAGMVAVSGV